MAEIAVKNSATGQIEYYPEDTDVSALMREGRALATPEDIDRRRTFLKNTTTGAQAGAAATSAANAATFGVFADDSAEAKQKQKDFAEASPTMSALSKVVGAAAPALLTGGAAGMAGAAVGLSGRAAALGASVAEELVGNTAFEMAESREQDRDISVANIIIGTGLGTGVSMAARAVKGGAKVLNAPKASGVLDVASTESQWLSKGRKVSGERRAVGAQAASDVRAPATSREVEAYAAAPEEFHAQVNQAGHDALADAFTGHESVTGTTGGAARQVHGLAFKEQDVIPHMLDVDPAVALGAVQEHVDAALRTAAAVKGKSPAVARRIQAAAEAALKGMDGVEGTAMGARGAVGLNRLKQELDDVTGNFLSMKGADAKAAGKELEKTANALRANLQDKKTWGQFWADRQTNENALWSGDNGIIQLSNSWQPEVFAPIKGKARVKIDDQLSQAMNRTPRTNLAEHFRDMDKIKARKILNNWENTVDQWERMTQLKEESGLVRAALDATGESPVDVLKKSLAEQKQIIEELRFIHDAAPRAKPILDKLAASGAAKAQGELLFDAASSLPGPGTALKLADNLTEKATGKSIRDRLFKPEALAPAREFDRAASLQAISERQAARGKRVVEPPKGPQGGPVPAAPANPGAQYSIAGKSHADLGADKFRPGVLEGLRKDEGFKKTGVPSMGSSSAKEAIVLQQDLHGKPLYLIDGSHRLQVAREQGLKELPAIVKDKAGNVVFKGAIPIDQSPEAALSSFPPKTRVQLEDVRKALGNMPREEQDQLLKQMQRDGKLVLMQNDNPRDLTKSARDSAMTVGDSPRHLVYFTPIAGGAAVVGASALTTTDALAEVSDNSRAITERAALGLTVKESRAPRLQPLAERFKDGAPDLNAAFRMKTGELRQIIEDPMGYVQGMTAAFGQIAEDHPGLFQQMVQRTTVGAHYLMANLPPSVGISMVHPHGIAPDSLAVMKFAAMYNAVFSPGDVVYDVGTGDATPTQIRALREVHPDIYENLRTDVLKQISQVGQKIPFETLRSLDNLFDMPGVAGLAFSPAMTQTMAGAYADKQPQKQQSLGGESVIAPDLASSKLAGLAAVK